MSQIPRYLYGSTNVSLLQSQRSSAITPAEGAAAAAAPYKAIADATKQISDDLYEVQQHRNMVQDADDASTAELNFGVATATRKQILDQSKAENWNADRLQDELDTVTEQLVGTTGSISDRGQEKYQKALDAQSTIWQIQNTSETNMVRYDQSIKKTDASVELMLEGENFGAASSIVETAIEDGRYSQEIGEKKLREISDGELKYKINNKSDMILKSYDNAKNRDAFYERLVTDENLDPEVKELAITKVENHRANLNYIDKKKAAVAKVGVLKDQTLMKVAIELGAPLPMSVGEFVNSGMGYTPEMDAQMITWGQELILKQIKGAETDGAYQEFEVHRRNGVFLENSKANSKLLDQEIRSGVTEEMTSQDVSNLAEATMKDAGFTSFTYDQMFNTSPRNNVALGEAAEVWGRMMLNTDMNNAVQTNVGDEQQTLLNNTWNHIEAGIDLAEAGQMAIDMNKAWDRDKVEMSARQDYYGGRNTQGKSRGNKAARDSFKSLVDDSFDTIPWLKSPIRISAIDDPGQADFITEGGYRAGFAFYEEYFYDSYMRTDNLDTAARDANLKFSQNFNMNNINGDMQIERGGVKGNWNWKREDWISENKEEVFIYGADGAEVGSLEKAGDISYRKPVTIGDDLVYQVWGEDGPLMQDVTVDGKVDRQMVIDRISTKDKNDKEIETIREETAETIKGYEKEYETALRMDKSGNIYSRKARAATIREYETKVSAEQQRAEQAIQKLETP